jgi:hypothetical protein
MKRIVSICLALMLACLLVTVASADTKQESILLGDVDGNGVINEDDLVLLREYLNTVDDATGESAVVVSEFADITEDGKIDGRDLIRLRKYLQTH